MNAGATLLLLLRRGGSLNGAQSATVQAYCVVATQPFSPGAAAFGVYSAGTAQEQSFQAGAAASQGFAAGVAEEQTFQAGGVITDAC